MKSKWVTLLSAIALVLVAFGSTGCNPPTIPTDENDPLPNVYNNQPIEKLFPEGPPRQMKQPGMPDEDRMREVKQRMDALLGSGVDSNAAVKSSQESAGKGQGSTEKKSDQ